MGGQVSQRKTGSWTIAAVRNSVGELLYHSSRFSWHVSDLLQRSFRSSLKKTGTSSVQLATMPILLLTGKMVLKVWT